METNLNQVLISFLVKWFFLSRNFCNTEKTLLFMSLSLSMMDNFRFL